MKKPYTCNTATYDSLQDFRTDRGLTGKDLAVKLGYSPSVVCQIETERMNISDEFLRRFMTAYPGYLVKGWEGRCETIKQADKEERIIEFEERERISVPEGNRPPAPVKTPEHNPTQAAVHFKELGKDLKKAVECAATHCGAGKESSKIFVLRGKETCKAYPSRSEAIEQLSKIILSDPAAFGYEIIEADLS